MPLRGSKDKVYRIEPLSEFYVATFHNGSCSDGEFFTAVMAEIEVISCFVSDVLGFTVRASYTSFPFSVFKDGEGFFFIGDDGEEFEGVDSDMIAIEFHIY